jgi:septal ring factor EnvC (AmiA/AmiB activator)
MPQNADKFVQPTRYTGDYPTGFNGYTWLDWSPEASAYHPGDDYNYGSGSDDLGQDVLATANGLCIYVGESNKGYGNMVILKHSIGYNLKRFIKETYGVDTDTLYSLYAHLDKIEIKVGDEVEAGQDIANLGKSGTVSPHLHFEIYHLTGDLKNTSYRFYPVGWSKEKIALNWLPAYKFIEATKQIESFETFLGKTKEYWEAVEKDREKLLKELGDKEKEFLKERQGLQEQINTLTNENKQLKDETAKCDLKVESVVTSIKKEVDNLTTKLTKSEEKRRDAENRATQLLTERAENYKISEATRILYETIKNSLSNKKE